MGDYYPAFGLNIEHEPFRLISGWGTSEYASDKGLQEKIEKFEAIVTQIGYLPACTGMIFSKFPYDCLLAGHLALWLLDLTGGLLVVSVRTMGTAVALDELRDQVIAGKFPGKIYRLVSRWDVGYGPREHIWHAIDAEFLRTWIAHPSFNLF